MNIRSKIFGDGSPEEPVLRTKRPKGARGDALHSVAVPRDGPRRTNSRTTDRHRLAKESITVVHKRRRHKAQLVNLSGGGAMIEAKFQPKLWDSVELQLGDHGTIECAVRWIRDNRIGIEFAHETRLDCSADEQALLLREAINRSFPDMSFEERAAPDVEQVSKENDQRCATRHPLIWSGVLHHDYQSTPVRVRNISATGAMVQSGAPVRVGAEPLLELGEAVTPSATVEWVVGDQVGLRFHSPFDLTQLSRSPAEVAPDKWERPTFLDRTDTGDSPWDPRWQRLSLGELNRELEGYLKR